MSALRANLPTGVEPALEFDFSQLQSEQLLSRLGGVLAELAGARKGVEGSTTCGVVESWSFTVYTAFRVRAMFKVDSIRILVIIHAEVWPGGLRQRLGARYGLLTARG
jgi:hypothetical protein